MRPGDCDVAVVGLPHRSVGADRPADHGGRRDLLRALPQLQHQGLALRDGGLRHLHAQPGAPHGRDRALQGPRRRRRLVRRGAEPGLVRAVQPAFLAADARAPAVLGVHQRPRPAGRGHVRAGRDRGGRRVGQLLQRRD